MLHNHKRPKAAASKAIHVMGGSDLNILSNRVQAAAQVRAVPKAMGASDRGSSPMAKRKNQTGGK